MTRRKVCLLGAFAAGKTSLVRRRVHGTFSDVYLTTIGVRIEKLSLALEREAVELVVWDLHGEDRFQSVQGTYMRGAAGFLVVADLTRPETFEVGRDLERRARAAVEGVPVIWAANKLDLVADATPASPVPSAILTSARTGEGVHLAFERLASAILAGRSSRAR